MKFTSEHLEHMRIVLTQRDAEQANESSLLGVFRSISDWYTQQDEVVIEEYFRNFLNGVNENS